MASPLAYARHIGVNIGENNQINKKHWSSEPYLITVGSNCQLTECKFLHMEEEMFFAQNILILIVLVKL